MLCKNIDSEILKELSLERGTTTKTNLLIFDPINKDVKNIACCYFRREMNKQIRLDSVLSLSFLICPKSYVLMKNHLF